jgi:hypothetical protein
MINVYLQIHTNSITKCLWKKCRVHYVKTGDTYSYHCDLKGYERPMITKNESLEKNTLIRRNRRNLPPQKIIPNTKGRLLSSRM